MPVKGLNQRINLLILDIHLFPFLFDLVYFFLLSGIFNLKCCVTHGRLGACKEQGDTVFALPHTCSTTWIGAVLQFLLNLVTPSQNQREAPTIKEWEKKKKTHTCCDVKSLTLCRIWLISDHILWVSVRHVILMLSVTYWTTEKSYFRPSNWQIKTKDQITKRRREEQLTKRFYRLYLSTICLQPVLKIRGEKLSAVQTYCALQNDASFG